MSETKISIDSTGRRVSRRFASIDFARGIAIVAMLFLHIIGDTLNIQYLLENINNYPLINIIVLIILPFYGGLAGFFLLISSIGNMISMQRDLEKGKSVRSIVFKQIFGGILLLGFAMLSEALIGYHGTVGEFFHNLRHNFIDWNYKEWQSDEFKDQEKKIDSLLEGEKT